jgi:hypothetical protein
MLEALKSTALPVVIIDFNFFKGKICYAFIGIVGKLKIFYTFLVIPF